MTERRRKLTHFDLLQILQRYVIDSGSRIVVEDGAFVVVCDDDVALLRVKDRVER